MSDPLDANLFNTDEWCNQVSDHYSLQENTTPVSPPFVEIQFPRENIIDDIHEEQTLLMNNKEQPIPEDEFITKSKKKHPYGHGLFITYPQVGNITDLDQCKLIFFKVQQMVEQLNVHLNKCEGGVCLEDHHQTEGQHIHIVINWPKQERFYLTNQLIKCLDKCCKHGDYKILKNYIAASNYIKKDKQYWFNYGIEQQEDARKDHRKFQNQRTIRLLENGSLEPYRDGTIAPQNLKSTIMGIQMLKNMTQPEWDLTEKKVWFIYGSTRTGKSSYARQVIANGQYYIKQANNKWWDGYEGQETVILEDLPRYTDYMMYHLKMWLDTVHQRVEIKGSSIWLNAKNIVITSNHTLYNCLAKKSFDDTVTINQEDYDAVEARITNVWEATNRQFNWKDISTFEYIVHK